VRALASVDTTDTTDTERSGADCRNDRGRCTDDDVSRLPDRPGGQRHHMAVTVNVRWQEGTALFAIQGEVERDTFELMRDALTVASTDAEAIVIDVSDARLSDVDLLGLRHALDRAKVARPVLVCGSDGDRRRIDQALGRRAVLVDSLDVVGVQHGRDSTNPEPEPTRRPVWQKPADRW